MPHYVERPDERADDKQDVERGKEIIFETKLVGGAHIGLINCEYQLYVFMGLF